MVAFWRRHWWVDLLLGIASAVALRQASSFGLLRTGEANELYVAIASTSAALGTLAITPIAIVLALTPGPRLRALLAHHVAIVRRAMSWTVFANLLAVATSLVGLAVDVEGHPVLWLRASALSFEGAALLAMARLVWFFVAMLVVDEVDKDVPHQVDAA